jgi:hypothetical protein
VVSVAGGLIERWGFDKTTVEDVARRATGEKPLTAVVVPLADPAAYRAFVAHHGLSATLTGAGGDGGAPAAVHERVMAAVRTDYAGVAQWAFTGMALAMAVLLVLAAFYPRDRRRTA